MSAGQDDEPTSSHDAAGEHVCRSAEADESPAADTAVQIGDVTDRLLGRPRRWRRREVSAAAGVPLLEARRFWQALGFPGVGDEDMSFTDADVHALQRIVSLVRTAQLDLPLALSMTRAIARTTDHLAAWQASLLLDTASRGQQPPDEPVTDIEAALEAREGSAQASHGQIDGASARDAAERLLELADELEPLVVYAWRRHLAAALNGLYAEDLGDSGAVQRTVGFADMVGFTTLVARLSEQQLGYLVSRFEGLAADVVTSHGGRVVKTVGDEVLFTADRVEAGAGIALDLLEALREDPAMPALRVGVATGEVLSHLGDVFGTCVNRASRITAAARPDAVVVDDTTAAALSGGREYVIQQLRPRPLRGLGVTGMWTLERDGEQPAAVRPVRTVTQWDSTSTVPRDPQPPART